MKFKVLFLVFAMIFTMIVPVQANTTYLQENLMQAEDCYGKFFVYVKNGDDWNEVGSLSFGKNQSKKTIDIGDYLNSNTIIKLVQNGGGSAYLDAVLLGNEASVNVNNKDNKLQYKLSKEDLDISPVEDGVILEFNESKSSTLTIVGRIEPVVIGKEPLQFPAANNYKSKDEIKDFYTYTLDSNIGTVMADGELDEIKFLEPFVKEYRIPGSGHPSGDTYFWVMNDTNNLYVTMDVTPDNTFDGDKDYAKVYLNSNIGIKEFEISVPETTWGNTGFTYTDKVGYEHKVYEFVIPLNEINSDNIELAFVVYGTVAYPSDHYTPDLAYAAYKDVYVCVYNGIRDNGNYEDESYIWADIIRSDGTVINGYPIMLSDYYSKESFAPSIAYDFLNDKFMVVWCEGYSNTKIYGKLFELREFDYDDNDNYDLYINALTERFRITDNEDVDDTEWKFYDEFEPDVVFNRNYEDGDYNGHYLVVWSQRVNDNPANLTLTKDDIYGRFISSNGDLIGNNGFPICDESGRQVEPSITYSFGNEVFVVSWLSKYEDMNTIDALVINEDGSFGPSISSIDGNISNPSISMNEITDNCLLTWNENNQVKGAYLFYNGSTLILAGNEIFNISESDSTGVFPISVFGKDNMLCAWNGIFDDLNNINSYVNLRYLDIFEPISSVFRTSDPETTAYYEDKCVAIASNYLNETLRQENFLIAYVNEGVQDISYRVICEPPEFEPFIEFDKNEYSIDLYYNNSTQTKVSYFEEEDVSYDITNHEYLHFISNDESIATINEDGLITGVASGTTTIEAVYYEPQYYQMSLGETSELPPGALYDVATVTVTKTEVKDPTLTIEPISNTKYVGDSFSVKVNYFDGLNTTDVTDSVVINIDDPSIATSDSAIKGRFICTGLGETILRTTHAGFEAAANLKVIEKPTASKSSSTPKTPIGEILVNNKVIKTLYEEDVKVKNNTYTFTANKDGDTAKLWLNSNFYKDLAKDTDRIINFVWDRGTYTLPLSCHEILDEIGSSAKKVSISIENVDDIEVIDTAKVSAAFMGGEIISDLIDFSVLVEKTNGNVEIDSFDFYAVRTINEINVANENISTAMKLVEDKEVLTFAPSVFNEDYASIKYRGNGIFTIIENPQTFSDISNHWAKINIEKLATRNIAFGKQNKQFAPDELITRAEFAVMITRALGITEEEGSHSFKDVSNEWFAEDISTAFEASLINGRNDDNFYPNEKINRKDMAVMINNTLKFTDKQVKIADIEKALSIFTDSDTIDDYAKESTAACVNSGIIMGRDNKEFDPDENATRAEASAIIERMLRYLEFMD